MYKENYNIEDIRVRACHKNSSVTMSSYIEGHRKGDLDGMRESNGTVKTLKNITCN
jgi:hypothetical protein